MTMATSSAIARFTVSIGIGTAATAADFRILYGLADEALYEAKRGGRDRVAIRLLRASEPSDSDLAPVGRNG